MGACRPRPNPLLCLALCACSVSGGSDDVLDDELRLRICHEDSGLSEETAESRVRAVTAGGWMQAAPPCPFSSCSQLLFFVAPSIWQFAVACCWEKPCTLCQCYEVSSVHYGA